jgi:hypothetical protein
MKYETEVIETFGKSNFIFIFHCEFGDKNFHVIITFEREHFESPYFRCEQSLGLFRGGFVGVVKNLKPFALDIFKEKLKNERSITEPLIEV